MRAPNLFLIASVVMFDAGFCDAHGTPPDLTETGNSKPLDIDRLLNTIRPSKGEDPFETIPWQTNLWEARKLAAKEGKPLLLWEMDGHPLGCG